MDDFWGLAVLLALILVAFVAILARSMLYYSAFSHDQYERVRFTDYERHLKSGDILLYVAHTHGYSNSIFTGDFFSHGGIVFDRGGALHVTESTVDTTLLDPATGV